MTVAAVAYGPAVMSRWHPWRVLGRMSHVRVEWTHDLPAGVLGDTDGRTHIRMLIGQLQTERRCTITHEMIHVERGDDGCCDLKAEARVRRETARRMITIFALGEALAFYGELDVVALADEMWVDLDTLRIRLDPKNLHPAERHYLRRRLAKIEGAA